MKRTSLKSLILLNWKGLFYHRFDLHERVTALEGQNGAGKTTVMIAAYVVLLPDLTKLRFTNVGEHGATGGDRGIYGRLGEPGRPTYSVLDVWLPDGARLLCGVQLVRKGAPSLELTPFVIPGLSWDVAPQDLLLERTDVDTIPDLDGLRQNAARLGGRLITFPTAKEYFAALFDYGVTPMRLVSEDEREKFNEVLRTSMVGGISRALGGELRSFLLKEETGLADALKQMRSNLDACRKTRSEVKEAEQIESQIHAVLDSGQEMFAAAVHAVRSRTVELRRIWDELRSRYDGAYEQLERLNDQVAQVEAEQGRVEQACQDFQRQQAELRTHVERLRQRCALDKKLDEQRVRCQALQDAAAQAGRGLEQARLQRERCRRRVGTARDTEARAAQGLADLRRGMEELSRRAAAYSLACEARARVRTALVVDAVDCAQLPLLEQTCRQEIESLDGDLVKMDRRLGTAAQDAASFARVAAALSAVSQVLAEIEPVEASTPYEKAQKLLRLLRELDGLAQRVAELSASLKETRGRATEQKKAQAEAAGLSGEGSRLACAADVFAAQQQAELQHEEAETRLREAEAELRRLVEAAESARGRIKRLEIDAQVYAQVRARAYALEQTWRRPLSTSGEVEQLRIHLDEQLHITQRDIDSTEQELATLQQEIWSTEQSGCISDALRRACDQVDGELIVSRFEEIPLEEAGRLQAQLGPLYEAILVDDLEGAVSRLAALDNRHRPDTIWLLDADSDLQHVLEPEPAAALERDVLVRAAGGHRLTRVPERPVLGSRARMRRVSELRKREQSLSDRLLELRSAAEGLAAGRTCVAELLRQSGTLDRGDPAAELTQVRLDAQEAEAAQPAQRQLISERRRESQALAERRARLMELCKRAHLLDLAEQEAAAQSLALQLQRAQHVHKLLKQGAESRALLEAELECLRAEPLSAAALALLEQQKKQMEEARDGKARLLRDLRHLIDNEAALGWADAEVALLQRNVETSTLQAQLETAKQERLQAEQALEMADGIVEAATGAAANSEAALLSAAAELQKLTEDHVALGGEEQTPRAAEQTLRDHENRLTDIDRLLPEQERRRNKLLQDKATLSERQRQQKDDLARLQEDVQRAERTARPEQERCERIERRAQEAGVLATAMAERYVSKFTGQGAVNLWGAATAQRACLCERLRQLREGASLAQQVEHLFSTDTEQSSGEAALESWLRVRSFLLRCVPAQIAEANDPEVALTRLREHLRRLGHKLSQQEDRLRGNSQDVAHNIEGMIRRARKQVSQLNQDLGMVRFGSIESVRIKMVQVEKMERVLQALKEGAVQTMLFHSEMPLEEALEEVFRSYGGGRSGGHKLLDYREYLELVVEIRRQVSPDWELVNATRMSTGEAIGVGAAVMMVILAAWERDANLLRPKRAAGTLRLLFLDEANRLSRDSLDVLFDLCEGLQLQMLIAAPEVANAEGNITHHLVRAVQSGREEVRVSARCVVARPKEEEAAVHVA